MRCVCCNRPLTDYETSIKGSISGKYLDSCVKCLTGIGVQYKGNDNFKKPKIEDHEDIEDEFPVEDFFIDLLNKEEE